MMDRSTAAGCIRFSLAGLVILASPASAELTTITIGQNGQLNWRGEGDAPVDVLPARYRFTLGSSTSRSRIVSEGDIPHHEVRTKRGDPNKIFIGHAPSQRVELDSERFPGSLHPLDIAEGDDIAVGTIDRGGFVDAPNLLSTQPGFRTTLLEFVLPELFSRESGDETEAWQIEDGFLGVMLEIDLGGRFGMNRIRFYPRNTVQLSETTPFQDDFMRGFNLFTNDGINLTKAGGPQWRELVSEAANRSAVVDIELDPPRIVQHLRLVSQTNIHWEIDEIEMFGEGFVPDGRYVSNLFDAGEPVAWTFLRWAEEIVNLPEFSSVEVRTRTGTDDSPFVFTRRLHAQVGAEDIPFAVDSETEEMSQKEYETLPAVDALGRQWNAGDVQDDLVNWAPFSAPYPAAAGFGQGVPILSPSPRRYFQFQVSFEGSDLTAARILNDLSFSYTSPPLADSLRGEIFPREADVASTNEFTYSVLARISSPGLTGFDTIEIATPSRVAGIDSVEVLNADGERLAFRAFSGLDDTTLVDGFRIVAVEDQSFALQFPRVGQGRSRVDVHLRAHVFTYSTDFAAVVRLQSEPTAFQGVDSGDAGFLGPGDDAASSGTTVLSLHVLDGGRLLDGVVLAPNPFSPNGDGVNEQLAVRYDLLSVTAPTPVTIRVYDLAGRPLALISEAVEASGRYDDKRWDGRDTRGELLPPGLYLIRIHVDGDAEDAERSGVVALVY